MGYFPDLVPKHVLQSTGVNLSGLTDANDFSSPDGMWFDDRGVLWLQTDDGAYTDKTNCMMLAALPGSVSDGVLVKPQQRAQAHKKHLCGAKLNDSKLRRFLGWSCWL